MNAGRRTSLSAFAANSHYVSNYGRFQFITPIGQRLRVTATAALFENAYPVADVTGVKRSDQRRQRCRWARLLLHAAHLRERRLPPRPARLEPRHVRLPEQRASVHARYWILAPLGHRERGDAPQTTSRRRARRAFRGHRLGPRWRERARAQSRRGRGLSGRRGRRAPGRRLRRPRPFGPGDRSVRRGDLLSSARRDPRERADRERGADRSHGAPRRKTFSSTLK